MSKSKANIVTDILKRLKRYLNLKSDRELSTYLGLSESTVSMWKQRATIDFKLILSKCPDISLDYLITGVPPPSLSERNQILGFYQIPLIQRLKQSATESEAIAINNSIVISEADNRLRHLETEIKRITDWLNL